VFVIQKVTKEVRRILNLKINKSDQCSPYELRINLQVQSRLSLTWNENKNNNKRIMTS
jgi:hypothetical protein